MKRISKSGLGRSLAVVTAVAGTVAGIASSADGASAQSTTHRMTVTSRQIQDHIVNGVDVATDKILHNGAVVGYDVTSCRVNPHTHIAACDVAVGRAGGLLYSHARVNIVTGRGRGTVTGGTRNFRGATGSVKIALPLITITWRN